MIRKNQALAALCIVGVFAGGLYMVTSAKHDYFTEYRLPISKTDRLFDLGVVDANSDTHLDFYTSNHHFRQVLFVGDGHGGFVDVLSKWGLDQSTDFPQAELAFDPPDFEEPGVYVYWLGTQLIIRAHQVSRTKGWRGKVSFYEPVKILKNEGFEVEKTDAAVDGDGTKIEFASEGEGFLRMRPGGQGLPILFEFSDNIAVSDIFVGRGRVSPVERTFSLAMRDRHAMAWADYNSDDVLDVFINRGALGGMLRSYPNEVRAIIKDELLVSSRTGEFNEVGIDKGITKRGCSGRHARWLDIDNDGLLDLFVNCYDRDNVEGNYPKQLYRQDDQGLLSDIANKVGLGLPDEQIASFAWFDVEGDGDLDVLGFQDEGLYLYRNKSGHFHQEFVYKHESDAKSRIGDAGGSGWFYDGKLSIADYDGDGDIDVFCTSKRGNVLIINRGGALVGKDPVSVGLPASSIAGNWVDYDNDGVLDLHLVPDGLYRQVGKNRFESEGLLSVPESRYDAAIPNWLDIDGDGRMDLLMALHESPEYRRWWEINKKPRRPSEWDILAYRNRGNTGHWLQVKLIGAPGNRQGIGARVAVVTKGGTQIQEVGGGEGSFFSQGHYRLYYGLGPYITAESIKVRWSDGYRQQISQVPADRLVVIERDSVAN